ncbi:MAG TPA: hypothetical protein VMB50_11080 [Myxococcales bacterium]|nr:hypothetical protein [Myxococcales bacterium]
MMPSRVRFALPSLVFAFAFAAAGCSGGGSSTATSTSGGAGSAGSSTGAAASTTGAAAGNSTGATGAGTATSSGGSSGGATAGHSSTGGAGSGSGSGSTGGTTGLAVGAACSIDVSTAQAGGSGDPCTATGLACSNLVAPDAGSVYTGTCELPTEYQSCEVSVGCAKTPISYTCTTNIFSSPTCMQSCSSPTSCNDVLDTCFAFSSTEHFCYYNFCGPGSGGKDWSGSGVDNGALFGACTVAASGDGYCLPWEFQTSATSTATTTMGLCSQAGTAATNAACTTDRPPSGSPVFCVPGDTCQSSLSATTPTDQGYCIGVCNPKSFVGGTTTGGSTGGGTTGGGTTGGGSTGGSVTDGGPNDGGSYDAGVEDGGTFDGGESGDAGLPSDGGVSSDAGAASDAGTSPECNECVDIYGSEADWGLCVFACGPSTTCSAPSGTCYSEAAFGSTGDGGFCAP